MRVLVSLNWLLGTACLFAAVFYGFIDSVLGQADTTVIEQTVANIAKAETSEYATRNRYVTFLAKDAAKGFADLKLSVSDDGVLYEAVDDREGGLMVTARIDPVKVRTEAKQPLVYSLSMKDGVVQGSSWLKLADSQRGLGLF